MPTAGGVPRPSHQQATNASNSAQQRANAHQARDEPKASANDARGGDAAPGVGNSPAAVPAAANATSPALVLEVAPPSTPPRIKGPNERCGGRVLLALWLCIERECRKDDLNGHAECVKWRNDQEQKATGGR
jgi:hypothetical protein